MSDLALSPLAPENFPMLHQVPGVHLGATAAGIKYKGRPDLMLATFAEGSVSAGVFTRSKMPAAPVVWSQRILRNTGGAVRGLVVNAGNANAFTGKKGDAAAENTARCAADAIGCGPDEILLASTGVIGEPLDTAPLCRALPRLYAGLSPTLLRDAAEAIRTTDTFAKGASRLCKIGDKTITVSGIAKGSGMIAPDMATMLGFVFTNANLTAGCLQSILGEATDQSFNAITVDSDTSTNDTVFAFASACRGNDERLSDPSDPRLDGFKRAFRAVMTDLAHQIVRDGEGASKFVTVQVDGAENEAAAKAIALSVANSPLVKTAIAGEDPNWGRIVMAVGKSGELADPDALGIWFGDIQVAASGAVCSRYREEDGAAYMKAAEIVIRVDVGVGAASATVWTCDMTHGYISINADYRS